VRERDQHVDERRDQRAVDLRDRPKSISYGIPPLLEQEIEAESAEGRQRPFDEGNKDAAENDEHPDRRGAGESTKDHVADTQPVERLGPRRYCVDLDRIALQRNVNHGSPPGGLHPSSPGDVAGRAKSKWTFGPPHPRDW